MRLTPLMVVTLALPLSACGFSLAGNGNSELAVRPIDNGELSPETSGAQALEEARALMRGGNVMAAMTAFRIAQRDQATAAEATNGLGVAWATLGRSDLAQKHFLQAIALAPDDARFAANLERLAFKTMAAAPIPVAPHVVAQAVPNRMVAANTLRGPVKVEARSAGRVMRVSATEVRVGARDPQDRLAERAVGRSNVAIAASTARSAEPAIRVATPRRGDRLYPLRVTLPTTRTAMRSDTVSVSSAPAATVQTYPVRVRLPVAATQAGKKN